MRTVTTLVLLLVVHLSILAAEPISTLLFPDDPEFPAYKDHITTTTRRPVRVLNSRQQKKSRLEAPSSQEARSSGLRPDPNAKKQLTQVTSFRQARRQFRYDRRDQQGLGDDLSLVGVVPPQRGGARGAPPPPSRPEYSVTRDGVPVVEMGPGVTRQCPKPTGRFPIMRHCDKYLECVFNSGYVRSCAPGTKFDSVTTQCNFPYRVRCIDDFEMYDGPTDLSAAASTLPPLTPSVMEMPTAQLRQDGSVSSQCPKPAGMFAIPNRCDAFLNCWDGYGHVQQCAPGTLFNCHTEKCDFPYNVRCVQSDKPQAPMIDVSMFARSGIQARSRFGSVMAPPSGQRLRMRGGRSLSQGHVQLYHEGQWNHVCEDEFTRHMADTICWDMGFKRGSKDVDMKAASQFKLSPNYRMISLRCTGKEEHVYDCMKNTQETCKVVAVACEQNSLSACAEGYRPFGERCYKVHATDPRSREDALTACRDEKAELLTIETQEENDFVSEMLQYLPNIGCLYTAGVGVTIFSNPVWIWETNRQTVQFNRWWPGWNRRSEGSAPATGASPQCLVLQSVFPAPPQTRRSAVTRPETARDMDSGYFWWTAENCTDKRAFVCEAPQNELGCIRGSGSDYRGSAASTESGQPCLHWNDPLIRDLTTQLMLDTAVIGDHNHCRNPDMDERPWCFVSARDYDYCDIPRCEAVSVDPAIAEEIESELALDALGNRGAFDAPGAETGGGGCGENMFQCRPGECKFFSWVCDGEEDCSNGKDESDCHNHLTDYDTTHGKKLVGYDVEKWMFTELNTCARRCSETKDFLCRAFNYRQVDQTCFLLDSNVALSGAVEPDVEFVLYELRSEIPSCNNMFVCPSGKCINQSQVCDGRRDCPDEADETRCRQHDTFEIRLVGGQVPSEGRIEVKAQGRWGVVCDDLLSTVDGDVICRHLGYPLGASEVVTNAGFGSGNGVFLMDDLNCRGDEERVNDCDFAGWGRSDCTEAEVAGVKCRVEGEACTSKQWRCRSGKCIDLTYVCDKVDDCGDFSDEEDILCKLPLKARLVGGTNSSGRVELRYKGIWGTACDDDFDSEDAQVVCRMLGFEGSAVVHDNAKYGPGSGQIWIDQLNCQGNEKSVDECHHLPWGSNNCAHEEDVGVSCHASVTPDPATGQAAVPSASPPLGAMLPAECGLRVVPDTPIIPLDQNPKIVSGVVTEPGSHPWMVGVRIKAGAETAHWCGAVIVSEWHIISAAHCLLDYPQQVYVLRVGDYDNQVVDAEEQEFTIDRMYPHEEFNKGTYLNHDIIIIRVKPVHGKGIQFGTQVQPVCLAPPEMEYQPGRKCTIAGWGSTGRRAAYARRLRSVSLPLLPITTCTARHVYGDSKITDGMYCAGYLEGGIDTCQGDSGGPMVCDVDGVGVLYGVTSWGQGCARPNKPGVYTKITSYLPWIARTIETDLRAY